ncbi:MAG: cysteine hydrolase [Alphaproteobacteria bacterium]|nr:cysteine hydrolase [Alphaproteobacteria bacterium]
MTSIYVYGAKKALPKDPAFESFLEPARTAVISIDMHEGHLSESPDCPCPAPRAREIVEPIDRFHVEARTRGLPIIHVRTVLRPSKRDDVKGGVSAWRLVFPLYVGPIPGHEGHAIAGSPWTALRTKVEPSDELIETKKRLSIFYPTDLDFLLRNMGVRAVVLNGGFTDCCVLNAAFDASNHDYRVVVARDLVRGTNEEMEDAALKMMSLHMALVMDAADILSAWDSRGARRKAAAK